MTRIARRLAGIGASDLQDAAEFDAYVGPAREVTVDQVRGIFALHDGITPGGKRPASAAQGALALTALQPIDVGSAAFASASAFATAAQGALADTSAQRISVSSIITVPGNYPTYEAAMDALASAVIWPSATMTVRVSGRFPAGAGNPTKIMRGPFIGRVKVVGDDPVNIAVASFGTVTGTPGNWSVTYSAPALPPGMAVGDTCQVYGMTDLLHWGAWKITAITGNNVTFKNTTYLVAPALAQTGTITWFPTQLMFNGKTAFSVERGQMVNVALVGDRSNTDCFGIICKEWTEDMPQQGSLQLNGVAINGFGAEGLRSNYGGVIFCNNVFVSDCGNNGIMARGHAQITLGNGVVTSGNGYRVVPGGNNGVLVQNSADALLFGTKSIGNKGDGFFSRSCASLLGDNSAPLIAYGNENDYHTGHAGFLQAEGGFSTSPRTHSYLSEGEMITTGAHSLNATVNAFVSMDLAYLNAIGAQVTGAGANGFVALDGAKTDGAGSKVVSCGGTPYYADKKGWTTMTGKTGLTASFPTANTAPTGIAGYVKD